MVNAKQISMLQVRVNGRLVGYLHKLSSGALKFQYAPEWLTTSGARPISLSLPLKTAAYEGDRVYNFFDNLLPDSERIRAMIQSRFQITSSQPFDLLAAIGLDCVGAIQLCSEQAVTDVEKVLAQTLTTPEIVQTLEGYRTAPLGMIESTDDFRISVAGAQEKTALLWHHGQWCRPKGITPTSHIFKLPIGAIGHGNLDLSASCENEWLCLAIAQAFGFETARAEVKRFDNVKGTCLFSK